MFKNILLSIFSILLTLVLIEFVIGPIWLQNRHDIPDKASYEFYKKYYKECGRPGVRVGGTVEQQQQAVEDTVNFFKKHLK